MNAPSLVILAAGLGRRYGGDKQVDAVGPGSATLMDYSVFDARRAGFGRVVLVIREEMEAALRNGPGSRFERAGLPVRYVPQRLDDLPGGFAVPHGRAKPWGTGQAVLAADLVDGPFAVINADDFYGRAAFATLGEFLGDAARVTAGTPGPTPTSCAPTTHAMVGYRLRDTLPECGAVARAVCGCSADGWLESIVERRGIGRTGSAARYVDELGASQSLTGDELVSMNMWGFQPAIFDDLRQAFRAFLEQAGRNLEAEFYLPAAVQAAVGGGTARVRVLPAAGDWCGLTHAEDRARVERMIAELIARGEYPRELWS